MSTQLVASGFSMLRTMTAAIATAFLLGAAVLALPALAEGGQGMMDGGRMMQGHGMMGGGGKMGCGGMMGGGSMMGGGGMMGGMGGAQRPNQQWRHASPEGN